MAKYVYIKSEPNLHTVGFYNPAGKWEPESDHEYSESAAERCHWLNGGFVKPSEITKKIDSLRRFNADPTIAAILEILELFVAKA